MLRAIGRKFEELKNNGKKAFIPFITAGDPDLETTVRLVLELERAGSHVVELGIPFSDPLADGPTIQRSSERALRHGYGLSDYLEAVRSIRRHSSIPLVLFSYFNPILQYGLERLASDARAAGVDGVLVTDMTPEEADDYCSVLERHELDPIFLVAPTSSAERVGRIVDCARGFVYLISRTGVTGARESFSESVVPTLRRVRERTGLPVAVGFGISTPEQVRAVWDVAEGAVVGSAIVAQIEKLAGSSQLPAQVGEYCKWLTEARNG
jgi:tryptophan synthase alpha chain